MDHFLKERKTLKGIVVDLATDGISIRAITRNKYIRQSITRDGFKLPANESDVMKLLHDDFDEKQNMMIDTTKKKIASGVKFSMTVDEVTTLRGRRYFGVNLHERMDNVTHKTGLIRILGACSALEMVEILKHHLNIYGISMQNDVVGSTQDGAAVNQKYIKHIDAIGQFCLNHGLHLGVCDTLYKQKSNPDEITISDDIDENDEFENAFDLEVINKNNDMMKDDFDYHDLLKNSRKLIKFIKLSSVRNHIFQSKNVALYGQEIELHLDVKTRWNSIPKMLKPLIKTEISIRDTLTEFKAQDLIESINFESLKTLLEAMEPVLLAVESLSAENASLLTADTVLTFMFDKLSLLNSEISIKSMHNLKLRIEERWNEDVMNLLRSLKDPSIIPSQKTITLACKLSSRLFGINDMELAEVNSNNNESCRDVNQILTLHEELHELLQKAESSPPTVHSENNFRWLKSEFILFKNTGKRSENLQRLFDALLTIKPTSTDVERVFSVCASFCTKVRSRLSDKSLSALIFLKYYHNKCNK